MRYMEEVNNIEGGKGDIETDRERKRGRCGVSAKTWQSIVN